MSSTVRNESEVKEVAASPAPEASTPELSTTTATAWQAIFAPQYNTYYFYNPVTQETTWINPLEQQQQSQPEASTSTSTSTTDSPSTTVTFVVDTETAAQAQGIDPLLAHLDPSLSAPSIPGSSGSHPKDAPSFTARFNSRTGQFTAPSARTPGHLSEHERAKRMSEFYFDVGKWEEDLARRGGRLMGEEEDVAGEEGTKEKRRKRPSKKDLVCICAFFLPFSVVFRVFSLLRIDLKSRKDSRKSLKRLGCALNLTLSVRV